MIIETCEDYAKLARCMTGFSYARIIQNRLFGPAPITLLNTRKKGDKLTFSSSWEFIEENHLPGRFGITEEDGERIIKHLSTCSSDVCQDANYRAKSVEKIYDELKKENGSLGGLLICSAVHGGFMPLVLEKEKGWEKAMELLVPIFELYTDYRDDFVWPGEGRVRLEGNPHVRFNSNNQEGIYFADSEREPKRTITVPYDVVRKLRYEGGSFEEGEDLWRNPELYHVHISHPNKKSYNKDWGRVALELREDRRDVEETAEKIIKAGVGLKRVEQ